MAQVPLPATLRCVPQQIYSHTRSHIHTAPFHSLPRSCSLRASRLCCHRGLLSTPADSQALRFFGDHKTGYWAVSKLRPFAEVASLRCSERPNSTLWRAAVEEARPLPPAHPTLSLHKAVATPAPTCATHRRQESGSRLSLLCERRPKLLLRTRQLQEAAASHSHPLHHPPAPTCPKPPHHANHGRKSPSRATTPLALDCPVPTRPPLRCRGAPRHPPTRLIP